MSKVEHKPPVLDLEDVLPDSAEPKFYVGRLEDLPPDFREYDSSHRHTYFALFFFLKGKGTHTIDFQEFSIESDSLFFLKPGQVHSWKFLSPVRGFALKISQDFFSEEGGNPTMLRELPYFRFGSAKSKLILSDPKRLRSDFSRLLEENERNSERRMLSLLSQVVLFQAKKEYDSVPEDVLPPDPIAARFQKLLEENFLKQRNTSFYSRRLGIAPNTLNRICHETLGKSAKSVVHERLTLEIKRLLIHSNLNITQISCELGFSDNAYFSRYFRARCGVSPESFRNTGRKTP
ncbi:helix-turn-helix domain-containing protein [Leptospira gomenensis]|uniref:Helix-turn-helix domain-containing protein n=1 Tax=Leptospira gomenensis TaxID=2484974 RepID=A0A5F1YCU2_9LEPT|nr:AraC family transcriptional regulator [Leptospira gomenensis]TGK35577.1 helix-turn-helix domain-containing protein [Leptospira gomenensis]TGK40901.1 helix-turn-helix domain-containing protein [Leptospira gomenensis]TGK61191.1 helix-turn-helix domain-containing protein [Leptospira gomenensis]